MTEQAITLDELAKAIGAELKGDGSYRVSGVSDLETARSTDLSYMAPAKYGPQKDKALAKTLAGAIVVAPNSEHVEGRNYLIHGNPSLAFQLAAERILNPPDPTPSYEGVHSTAVIHESAQIGKGVTIGPYSVIDRNVRIGDGTRIDAHVTLYPGVEVGTDCLIYSQVVIRDACVIGNRVTLQPGAVIGSCGFGYTNDEGGNHVKLRQIGNVIIEDDVEVGANSAIDRARFQSTRIGRGTKIDNLVQIGHNVLIGEHNLICGQVGVAGSCETGRYVVLAGKAGVVGHVKLGDGVIIGGFAGVIKSIETAGEYVGQPAVPLKEALYKEIRIRNMGKVNTTLQQLKERMATLEKTLVEQ